MQFRSQPKNMLKEDFDDFEAKTAILNFANHVEIVSAVDEAIKCNRTHRQQTTIDDQGCRGHFVLAKIDDRTITISTRQQGIERVAFQCRSLTAQ